MTRIESTVTGNEPGTFIADGHVALKDQSQVGSLGLGTRSGLGVEFFFDIEFVFCFSGVGGGVG